MKATLGATVRATAEIYNVAGTLTDPATISFIVENPNNVTTTYTYGVASEVVKQSTGIYTLDLHVTIEGKWFIAFTSTSPTDAREDSIHVTSAFR